ncbi:uncharacterized protein WCC33_001436 [Rhinophrynus dorsalis]
MGDFAALLKDLGKTCQELEQIKAEQTKDHEWISKSFEKTLLSILRQEQSILNQVEEEHKRLRDQLASIQRSNELAMQNGVSEINNMVHEIAAVSAKLQQVLGASNGSEPVVKEIQERVAKIFTRKKSISISLQKVHFIPHPLLSSTLGEIQCEEQPLGFSIPCRNRKVKTAWDGSVIRKYSPLSEEKPPWEDTSQSSDDTGCVGVKIILEDDSDLDSGSSTKLQCLGGDNVTDQKLNLSPREKAVKEADNAAISPRTATKIWLSDIKHSPSNPTRPVGTKKETRQSMSTEESSKSPKPCFTSNKNIPKESPVLKTFRPIVNSSSVGRNSTHAKDNRVRDIGESQVYQTASPLQATHYPTSHKRDHARVSRMGKESESSVVKPTKLKPDSNGTICTVHQSTTRTGLKEIFTPQDSNIYPTFSPNSVVENEENSNSRSIEKPFTINGDIHTNMSDHDTLFRATAAYVCDEEGSDEGLEEGDSGEESDPKSCREVAIRDSRVPSARKNGDGEQLNWMSMDLTSLIDSNDENYNLRSYINVKDNQRIVSQPTDNKTASPLAVDYLRMSNDRPNEMSNEGLYFPPRPVSPTESVKSSYTFIIDTPKQKKTGVATQKPRSFSRLSAKGRPVINSTEDKSEAKNALQAPKSRQLTQVQSGGNITASCTEKLLPNITKQSLQHTPVHPFVQRSSSLPYNERTSKKWNSSSRILRPTSASERRDSTCSTSSCWSNPRNLVNSAPTGSSQAHVKPSQFREKSGRPPRRYPLHMKSLSKSESNLIDYPIVDSNGPNRLVRQFCKFGSGRAELNLPHGIYATTTGSIYVVDYGNRRLQVMNAKGKILQQIALEAKNYFDVAVSNRGLVALTNSTDRTVEVYNKHGRLLQVISRNWGAPRGITANHRDEFIVADMRLGVICALTLDTSTGRQKEITIVPGFNKPYLISSNSQGLLAISERGLDGGCCVKVLREDWQILKVLGLKDSPGPNLFNPWGVCIDNEGGVMVADWGHIHSIIYYPVKKPAHILVTEGLNSPRGLALWQDCLLLVADSMHNCIKVFQYQEREV